MNAADGSVSSHEKLILLPEDIAIVLGLASERAAREFLQKHGVPASRVGGRIFVLRSSLLRFLREREGGEQTPPDIPAHAIRLARRAAKSRVGAADALSPDQTRRRA